MKLLTRYIHLSRSCRLERTSLTRIRVNISARSRYESRASARLKNDLLIVKIRIFHNHSNWVALSRNDHHVRSSFDTAKQNLTVDTGFHGVEVGRHVADILITDDLINGRLPILSS